MPFIDCKITKKLTEEQKETLKAELGKHIALLHKTETYLMVGIADGYDLYFAGKKQENAAYVAVSVYGRVSSADSNKMTAAVCALLSEKAGLDPAKVYVTYQGIADWGWNGGNF